MITEIQFIMKVREGRACFCATQPFKHPSFDYNNAHFSKRSLCWHLWHTPHHTNTHTPLVSPTNLREPTIPYQTKNIRDLSITEQFQQTNKKHFPTNNIFYLFVLFFPLLIRNKSKQNKNNGEMFPICGSQKLKTNTHKNRIFAKPKVILK